MYQTEFAVVDLETTGLYPSRGDRIVEIGIVALDASLRPKAEWTTLVNPRRDVGPTSIHGITAGQVANAPSFRDIVGDVADCLGDRIVVGHNVRFDQGFLGAEFARAGFAVEWVPGLDTMWLAASITSQRRLHDCCQSLGIDTGRSHSAICDARAAAQLLVCCLGRLRESSPLLPLPRSSLPPVAPSGRPG